ncbi:MAG: DUF111 family protein, partial [Actinobacteria bacterium]|nr:DUF111 family protein [Actinomycetota bacterium]
GFSAPRHDGLIGRGCHLDDVRPELVGHTCGLLRAAGALEVWTEPVYMKKDRPGSVLHALVVPGSEVALGDIIISETGSLGVRRQLKQRVIAERGTLAVTVGGAVVSVKWGRHRGRITSVTPEYDSAAVAAAATGLPIRELMRQATEEAHRVLGDEADDDEGNGSDGDEADSPHHEHSQAQGEGK